MGQLTDDLTFMYSDAAFGTQTLVFGVAKVAGYLDQEDTLTPDGSGQSLLVKRTVFRIQTPVVNSVMASLTADSEVTIYDPETRITTAYRLSEEPELAGDGRETRLILRAG